MDVDNRLTNSLGIGVQGIDRQGLISDVQGVDMSGLIFDAEGNDFIPSSRIFWLKSCIPKPTFFVKVDVFKTAPPIAAL